MYPYICRLTKKVIICGARHGVFPSCFAAEQTALTDDQPPKHCCYWQPGQQLAIPISLPLSRLHNPNMWDVLLSREVCVCVCVFLCVHIPCCLSFCMIFSVCACALLSVSVCLYHFVCFYLCTLCVTAWACVLFSCVCLDGFRWKQQQHCMLDCLSV